jgi:hypothetical protein
MRLADEKNTLADGDALRKSFGTTVARDETLAFIAIYLMSFLLCRGNQRTERNAERSTDTSAADMTPSRVDNSDDGTDVRSCKMRMWLSCKGRRGERALATALASCIRSDTLSAEVRVIDNRCW